MPGQRLKQAREEKSLTADVIAQRLKLETKVVEAIEKNNFDVFPATAYARGYLRNYAREVDLNPEEIVTAYNEIANDGPALEPHVTQTQPQASSHDRHTKAVTWSINAASLLLLGLWWTSQKEEVDERVDLAPPPVSEIPDQQPVLGEGEHSLTLNTADNTAASEETEALEQEIAPEESQVPTVSEEPKALEHDYGVVYLNELPEPPPQVDPLEQSSTETTPSPTQESEIEVESASATPDTSSVEDVTSDRLKEELANDAIKINFSDESWVEVKDGTESVLYSGLAQPGERISVSGVMPYQIVIGRAASAKFIYKGEALDLDPLTRAQVARFVIDESGAHR